MFKSLVGVFVIFSVGFTLCNAKCGQVFDNKVSDADKKVIVNVHNNLRALIANGQVPGQPKAKNLGPLKWDEALAKQAQIIANTCEFKHVKVNDKRFYVGQNLGWTGSSNKKAGTEWKSVLQRWFDEYKNFVYPNKSNGVTGHYTQVVWADTKYVGCGYTWYRGSSWFEKLYVCNYGPGGNYVGSPPYKV